MYDPRSGYLGDPSRGPSSLFAILFAVSGICHAIQNRNYKSWRLLWLLPCSSILFTAGFICLEYNAFHPTAFAPSQGLLYSAATILLVCVGMCIIRLLATQPDGLKPWSRILFAVIAVVFTAIISLTAQGTSTFYNPGASPDTVRSGLILTQISVVLLLAANIGLLVELVIFYHRCVRSSVAGDDTKKNIRTLAFVLFACGLLMVARTLFRTVQIFSLAQADVWAVEALFWVFDALPLLACMVLLNVMHPVRLVALGTGASCT